MSWWQALLLGLIEGITEYLPVSSTGHLILAAWLLGLAHDPERWAAAFAFNVVIQFGAIAAVLIVYRERFRRMAAGLAGRDPEGRRLAVNVMIAFAPAALLGPLLDDVIETRLNGPWPVVYALCAGALVMLAVTRWRRNPDGDPGLDLDAIDRRTALLIGVAQCAAMWPGTSRSMATIVAALLLGLRATAAAEFSFFLGLVTLSAATGYKLVQSGDSIMTELGLDALVIGSLASTLSAALTVRWFVRTLNSSGLAPFAWYRLAVAATLTAVLAGRWLGTPDLPGRHPLYGGVRGTDDARIAAASPTHHAPP